jgi:hypothetical protein
MSVYLEEDGNIPTLSEVSPTNASHLHGLVELGQFRCHYNVWKGSAAAVELFYKTEYSSVSKRAGSNIFA